MKVVRLTGTLTYGPIDRHLFGFVHPALPLCFRWLAVGLVVRVGAVTTMAAAIIVAAVNGTHGLWLAVDDGMTVVWTLIVLLDLAPTWDRLSEQIVARVVEGGGAFPYAALKHVRVCRIVRLATAANGILVVATRTWSVIGLIVGNLITLYSLTTFDSGLADRAPWRERLRTPVLAPQGGTV